MYIYLILVNYLILASQGDRTTSDTILLINDPQSSKKNKMFSHAAII